MSRRRNKKTERRNMSRRNFLRGVGGTAVALPFLNVFGAGEAYAQDSIPMRVISIAHHQGWVPDDLIPGMSGGMLSFGEQLAPLQSHADRISVLMGLENKVRYLNRGAKGHIIAPQSLFTCMPYSQNMDAAGNLKAESSHVEEGTMGGPSIEQFFGESLREEGQRRSVNFTVGRGVASMRCYFSEGRDQHIAADNDPRPTFSALFGDVAEVDPEMVRRRDLRMRSLDKVQASMGEFQKKLGQEDRERLEQHAEWVGDLGARLSRESELVCAKPGQLEYPSNFNPRDDTDIAAANTIDMMVMALSCNMAPAASLHFSDASPKFEFMNGVIPNQFDNWHDMVHGGPDNSAARPGLIRGFGWFAEQVAYLMDSLAAIPEGGGTMLDNTLIVWSSEFDTGARHRSRELPMILLGGGGGHRGNLYMDYTDTGTAPLDVYNAMFDAADVDGSQFGMQGTAGVATSELFT